MFKGMKKAVRNFLALILAIVCFANNNTAYASQFLEKGEIGSSKYYYKQLNDLGKKIYNNFGKAKDKFWNNEEVNYTIDRLNSLKELEVEYYREAATLARQAYLGDNPEANIWFKESNYSIQWYQNGIVTMNLAPKEVTGRYADLETEELPEAIDEFEQIAKEFAETLEGTEEEMLTQIHDWIAKNANYDYTHIQANTRNAYGTIVEGESVCSGFAFAYKYIAELVGLDVLYVTGKFHGSPHAWNLVKLDGEWRLVDITYNKTSLRSTHKTYLFTEIDDGAHVPDERFTYPNN